MDAKTQTMNNIISLQNAIQKLTHTLQHNKGYYEKWQGSLAFTIMNHLVRNNISDPDLIAIISVDAAQDFLNYIIHSAENQTEWIYT